MDATRLISRYRSALMGFAQIWIVLMHCWLPVIPNRPILGGIESLVLSNGGLGVGMFLFLSGAGLTYSIRKGSLLSFYTGRLRRVLMPFWFMVIVYTIFQGHSFLWGLMRATGYYAIAKNFLAFLWFIPAIIILYLFFPPYHALMMRAKSKTAFTGAALMLWLFLTLLFHDHIRSDFWMLVNRIPLFMLGVWFGEAGREKPLEFRIEHWVLCFLSLLTGFLIIFADKRGLMPLRAPLSFVESFLCCTSICFLLAGLFYILENGRLGTVFRYPVRFLSFTGTFTLELYCIHQWLYGKINPLLEGRVSYLTINLISIPTLIAAGWLLHLVHMYFWKLIDRVRSKAK